MAADERKKIEAAMARMAKQKNTVHANPAGAIDRRIDEAMAQAKRRLLLIVLWITIVVIAGMALYLYSRGL
jgi:hypothetical protein